MDSLVQRGDKNLIERWNMYTYIGRAFNINYIHSNVCLIVSVKVVSMVGTILGLAPVVLQI
jgi:hypothetical protein